MDTRTRHRARPACRPGFSLIGGLAALLMTVPWAAPPARAHDPLPSFVITAPSPEDIAAANAESSLNDLEGRFNRAFRDRLVGRNLVLAIFLTDYSSGNPLDQQDPWLAEQVEEQAKLLARQAIYQAVADSVNDVQVLHRMKQYGNNLTKAELEVRDGNLDFKGPSLDGDGQDQAGSERKGPGSFSSRLKLEADFDLGLSWRTTFDRFEYRATYFLVSEDVVGMTLESRITDRTKVGLTYRIGPDQRRAIATLSFLLP